LLIYTNREYLHLPSDVVPATIKKRAPPVPMNRFPQSTGLRDNRPRNDRESYRRYIGAEKKEGPGPDFRPTFVRKNITHYSYIIILYT
jgi:small subunit ribosomal protein S10e